MEVKLRAQQRASVLALCFMLASLLGLMLPLFAQHSNRQTNPTHDDTHKVDRRGPLEKSHSLQRRVLTFEVATNKGRELACLLGMTDIDDIQAYLNQYKPGISATSQWVNFNSLAANGWAINQGADQPGFELDDFTDIFNVDSSDNVYQQWRQWEDVVFNGVPYPPSDGRYGNLYNVQGGLIAVDESYSPATTSPQLDRYVPLRQWSDIVFLAWQQLCTTAGVSVSGLTKMFQISVSGQDSQDIITEAVSQVGGSMSASFDNKVRFPSGSVGYYALLGTVNGFGQAWLLLQHRPQMGHLTINAISYFLEPENEDMCLYFEIGPYTAPA